MWDSTFQLCRRGLVVALAACVVALRGADNPGAGGDVLVKGTGVSITREELNTELARAETEATNRGEAIEDEARSRLQAGLLDRMIFRRLVIGQATDTDKRRALFEANAFVAGAKAEAPTAEAFGRRLKRAGFTEESFAADKYAEVLTATVLDRRIRSGIRVEEGAIRAAYEAQPERWVKQGVIRGIDLMASSRDPATSAELEGVARDEKLKQLRTIRMRAMKGEDFTKLVKQFSEDPQGREQGGAFTLAKLGTAPDLEQALSTAKPGEITEVLETPSGFHIVKVLEASPAGKISLTEATPQIRTELGDAGFKKQVTAYVAQLRRDASLTFAPGAPQLRDR